MSAAKPPILPAAILAWLFPGSRGDALLGDMNEEYFRVYRLRGEEAARRWFWMEALHSAPSLLANYLQTPNLWRKTVNGNDLIQDGRKAALWSLLFIVPALMLVIPGLMFSILGMTDIYQSIERVLGSNVRALLDSPWVVLGGLGLALALNSLAVLNVNLDSGKNEWLATFTIRKSAWNLALLGLGGFLGLTLLLYLIAENFGPFF